MGASELELVVDTGSYSLLVNKGQYRPSNHSTPSGKSSYIQFSGGNENGTENIDVSFVSVWSRAFVLHGRGKPIFLLPALPSSKQVTISYINDTVSILDYELPNFMVGNITYQSAILPSMGVLGLSQKQSYSNPGDPTDSNGESFVQTLYDQKLIEDCAFGLVLGTNGQGELIFGGMEKEKYQEDLVMVKTTEVSFRKASISFFFPSCRISRAFSSFSSIVETSLLFFPLTLSRLLPLSLSPNRPISGK